MSDHRGGREFHRNGSPHGRDYDGARGPKRRRSLSRERDDRERDRGPEHGDYNRSRERRRRSRSPPGRSSYYDRRGRGYDRDRDGDRDRRYHGRGDRDRRWERDRYREDDGDRERFRSPPRKRQRTDDSEARGSPPAKRRDSRERAGREEHEKEHTEPPAAMVGSEEELMKMFGLPGSFDSTKGKQVEGNELNFGVKVRSVREHRQYMNRKGAFNSMLAAEATSAHGSGKKLKKKLMQQAVMLRKAIAQTQG